MDANLVHEIPEDDCLKLLSLFDFGRVVFSVASIVEIFPVNYHVEGRSLTFKTAPGTKLAGSVTAREVLFEIDNIGENESWSVIARGPARRLDTAAEREEAEALPLKPLIPTVKREFVRIDIEHVSGRRFHMVPEPDSDAAASLDPTD